MTDKRNSDGTFAKGNAGGPGRPPRATESEYLRVLMGACPLDTFREIVERAVTDAKAGDAQARAWLATYLVSTWCKPKRTTSPATISCQAFATRYSNPKRIPPEQIAKPGGNRAAYPVM